MKLISFDMPAEYTISVQGLINTRLKESIGKANVLIVDDEGIEKTELKILVKDQSHLNGIINTLYDARYVIFKIECIN